MGGNFKNPINLKNKIMKRFIDDPEVLIAFQNILNSHKSHVLENMEDFDPEVAAQKTRFYKWKCWLLWGHLKGKKPNKDGSCLRCGKIINIGQNGTP